MDKEEKEIIKKCQKGHLEDFGKLYEKYVEKIYRFVFRKTNHKQTAEDLTSQTFFKALENIEKFKAEKGFFSAWLYTIAGNLIIDHYRTKKIHANIFDYANLTEKTDLQREIANQEKLEKIKKYLEKLSFEQKEIVLMRIWDGLSYREISEIIKKNENNCKMIFSRAMAKIRKENPTYLLALVFQIIQ